jgi:hypothetical protein
VRDVAVGVLRHDDERLGPAEVDALRGERLERSHAERRRALSRAAHRQPPHADALLDELLGDGELLLALQVRDALRRQIRRDRLDSDHARSFSEK